MDSANQGRGFKLQYFKARPSHSFPSRLSVFVPCKLSCPLRSSRPTWEETPLTKQIQARTASKLQGLHTPGSAPHIQSPQTALSDLPPRCLKYGTPMPYLGGQIPPTSQHDVCKPPQCQTRRVRWAWLPSSGLQSVFEASCTFGL